MSEEKEEKSSGSGKSTWKCPECGQKALLYITPSYPPSCANPEKHEGKSFVMTKIS